MTEQALEGAQETINKNSPIVLVELIKANADQIRAWLDNRNYKIFNVGINLLAIHTGDKTLNDVKVQERAA